MAGRFSLCADLEGELNFTVASMDRPKLELARSLLQEGSSLMSDSELTVRYAIAEDQKDWVAMWRKFLHDKPDEPGDRTTEEKNWSRIMDTTNPLRCLVGIDANGNKVGFILFVVFPFTWSVLDVCYLEDLFVAPEARRKGYARALIDALAEVGRKENWYKIFWMTEADNQPAQRLYDTVARRMDYLRYDLNLVTPSK